MASSDTTVDVKITASLDPSLQASANAAKAEIGSLSGAATNSSQALKAVAASEAEVTAATTAMSHGAISTATREFRALFDELSSGRTRMTPGTLAIIAQRVYGLEASTLAGVAAVGLFAGALGYATYQALEATRELERLSSGFELTGRSASVSQGFIEQWVTSTWKIFDSTGETTKKIVALEAANGTLNATIINAANQIIPLFIKQYGDDAPKAMEHLLNALGNLTVNGFQKLDKEMLNLSPTQYAAIENMIRTGHETEAATTILEALGARGGIAIKSLQQSLESLQAEAVKLRSQFLTDQDATDGLTRASQEYLRVLREIQGAKQAIANAPQQEADKTFKTELDLANQINAKLTQRQEIEKNLATLRSGLAAAQKVQDTDLVNSFTQAINKETNDLNALIDRENQKKLAADTAANNKRLAEERRAQEERLRLERETDDKIAQIVRDDVNTDIQISRMKVQARKQALDEDLANNRISATQKADILRQLTQEEYNLDLEALLNSRQAHADDVAAYNYYTDQIRILAEKLKLDLAQIHRQETVDYQKELNQQAQAYRSMVNEITGAENQLIGNILRGRQSLTSSLLQFIGTLLEREIQADAKYLTMRLFYTQAELAAQRSSETGGLLVHLLTEGQKTEATIAGSQARVAAEQAAQAESGASQIASGSAQILNDAYKAAAGAYQAVVGIPVVGPVLAPIAAGTAFAAVAAFDVLTSAEGGQWEVPGGLYRLHEKEAVIPAGIANPMRNFFENGGNATQSAGSNINITVQAVDSNSVMRLLKRREISRQITREVGRGMTLNPGLRGAY